MMLWVGLGSGLGGLARVLLPSLLIPTADGSFPTDTLGVNIAGSFAIGLIASLTGPGAWLPASPATRQFLLAGFCGGFTTFSIFSLETMELIQQGRLPEALLYAALTLFLSMLGVALGFLLGQRINRL